MTMCLPAIAPSTEMLQRCQLQPGEVTQPLSRSLLSFTLSRQPSGNTPRSERSPDQNAGSNRAAQPRTLAPRWSDPRIVGIFAI